MKVDLNLFVVFEAIYLEGNITRAAKTLNLSQPAISHALAKLRNHFDDPLFVRQGHKMRPTALAKNVIADVREALHKLQVSLVQSQQFDPSTSRKSCTLSLHTSLEAVYLPPLITRVKNEAPTISFTSNRVRRTEIETKLSSGDIDLAIDILLPVSENIKHIQLAHDKLVVMARKSHPQLTQAFDVKNYLSLDHVLVSSRSSGPGIEDYELGRIGLQRKVALRCQHLFSACRIISQNDMLLTVPLQSAKIYAELFNLDIHPLPVELPDLDVHLYWHVNVDKEPANRWIRNKVLLVASSQTIYDLKN